jgi:tetraacyldisaccharide 4'-kinase
MEYELPYTIVSSIPKLVAVLENSELELQWSKKRNRLRNRIRCIVSGIVLLSFFQILIYPLSWIYQVIFWIDQKRKKKTRLPVDISISIGNLSVGGTGKTPFTIQLAKLIQTILSEPKITILSRGYGGEWSKQGGIVFHDSDPSLAGDEPVMIQNQLKNVNLIVGRNRIQNFYRFSRNLSTNSIDKNEKNNLQKNIKHILLLDDGFQHTSIQRDIDIVLVDAFHPEENGRTIPSGRLREKVTGLARAQILIFTRCSFSSNRLDYNQNWEKKIRKKFPHLKIFHATEEKLGYFSINEWKSQLNFKIERQYNYGFLKNKKVFAFCGLGNPQPFFNSIRKESPLYLETKSYRDHYNFLDQDIEFWYKSINDFDIFICTEKDIVKFSYRIPKDLMEKMFFLRIETKIFEFDDWIHFWKTVLVPMNEL